ncbi:MAG: hypothetical protein KGL16_12040 [Acidobacteriota bacterium]|nr:hypothetical protein [Acidobacteriota bacterium]
MAEAREEFLVSLASRLGLEPLSPAEIESVLALAATAAHGTGDRTSAPLSTFLAGAAAVGSDKRGEVLDRARQQAGAITGPHGTHAE